LRLARVPLTTIAARKPCPTLADSPQGVTHATDQFSTPAFHGGGVRGFRGSYDAFGDDPTEIVYEPTMFFLIDVEGTRVLFDTGMNARDLRADDEGLGIILNELRRYPRLHDRPCVPEASLRGPIAAVHQGEAITVDVDARRIDVALTESQIAERTRLYASPERQVPAGALSKYAKLVASASRGAVTSG
jgi:hypothetical protein